MDSDSRKSPAPVEAAPEVDALQGKQLFPNSSLSMDARSATNEPVQPELRRARYGALGGRAEPPGTPFTR